MNKALKIIYMGTPEFAVPPLELLISQAWGIVAVITAVDKPQGRGRQLLPSPVKETALKHGIPVLQPPNLKAADFIEKLQSYQADLQVVVAFRMLPEVVWNMPPLGTFNLHASLLPNYRGAAPINWAIINGEKETGVTTFLLKQDIDTGNILFQEKEPILPEDNVGTLYDRLKIKGAGLVLKTVEALASNQVNATQQNEEKFLQHAPKIYKETCQINWTKTAIEIHNLVRGLSPYPAAWTMLNKKSCKIFRTETLNKGKDNLQPGDFITDNRNYLYFQTKNGMISILEIQLEGKKKMKIEDFLRGNTL
ncbi:MAG: methionyl-tRNA formyltransferase [Cyclobacteriaceae bacterium]